MLNSISDFEIELSGPFGLCPDLQAVRYNKGLGLLSCPSGLIWTLLTLSLFLTVITGMILPRVDHPTYA